MSGMQLSGLASGMDWQNVVEQLMELERYPIRRAEAEKASNEQRVSQLGILESRLGQLKSASDNLANADLWDGRSASLSDTDTTLLSASAETGTLIGEYVISDATKATDSVLSGEADMTSNIVSADTIENLNTSTDITSGTITINGTILTIDASGSSGGAFSLSNDLATAATNIGTNVSGVTAGVENGRFYLESDSEIIVGHADDSSNFLSVMKLFSQTETNYISHVGTDYYSKIETSGTTSTTNFFRTGEYAWDGTNYYKALQDVPRESDLSTAPNSYFDTGIASGAASLAQVDTITGLAADAKVAQVDQLELTAGGAGDTWDITIDGIALTTQFFNNTLALTAADIATAFNNSGLNNRVIAQAIGGGAITLTATALTAGTGFTTGVTPSGGAAATIATDNDIPGTTVPNVTGDTFTVTVDGNPVIVDIETGTSAANIAADIAAAINADGTVGGIVTAAVNASDEVEVTADVAGVAFTMSVGFSEGASGGTITAAGTSSTTTASVIGGPEKYRSLSEFAIGSIDTTDSIKTALGLSDGTYEFTINGESFTVKDSADATADEIDLDNTTLKQFMTNITASSAGVTLSYNPVEDRFLLTNKDSGKIRITTADTSNTLMATMKLDYDNDSGTADNATFSLGTDATLTINGTTVTSNSNSVDGTSHGIDGLTVTIQDEFATADSDITITVASDTSGAKSAINSFISEYNNMLTHVSNVTETTISNDKVQTSIFSDNMEVTSLTNNLRAAVFGNQNSVNPFTMAGTGFERIQDIGIDFVSGSSNLQVEDSSLLTEALEDNGAQVREIFMSAVDDPEYYSSSTDYKQGEIVEDGGVYWVAIADTSGTNPPTYDPDTASANKSANWAFYGYDDDVARRSNESSDFSGTPVLNGIAYGMSYRLSEFIENFTSGTTPDPDDTESDGTISIQTSSLQDSNDRLDTDIANLEILLAKREEQMTASFVRMEEMQSKLQNQSKMLESSIQNNFGAGRKK